jgi:hypothetical protein
VGPLDDGIYAIKGENDTRFDQTGDEQQANPCACLIKKKALMVSFINQMTASVFDIRPSDLVQPDRGVRRIARARQIAMYLMHTSLSLSYVEIARLFERDRTTVSYACKVIEELRDIPATDDKLIEMERTLAIVVELAATPVLDQRDE